MNTFSSLNYYLRVQNSINYIESKLDGDIKIEHVAGQAYMSLPSLYRLFFAMTGRLLRHTFENAGSAKQPMN